MQWADVLSGGVVGAVIVAVVTALFARKRTAAEARLADSQAKKAAADAKKASAEAIEIIERVAAAQAERIEAATARQMSELWERVAALEEKAARGELLGRLKISHIKELRAHIDAGKPPPPPDPPVALMNLWGGTIPIVTDEREG